MTALLASVLGASLLGSLHCAGMCGGFVGFYAAAPALGKRRALGPHLAYSAGRLAAYATLGAAAGAVGAALDTTTGALLGAQRVAAVVSGLLIVVWGVVSLAEVFGARVPRPSTPPGLTAAVSHAIAAVAGSSPPARALVVGLLTGCLPCGWLYAFVVVAAGTGSALAGAVLMAVFWAGTLPVMLGLGLGIHVLAAPLRRQVPAACAVAMIVVGLFAVSGRMRAPEPAEHLGAAHHHASP